MLGNVKCVDQVIADDYAIYQGDSCEIIRAIPGDSIGFGIHSPPFSGLYQFSNYDQDISNNSEDTFFEHYQFLIQELLRVTMPGRLHSVHVMQLPMSKIRHGRSEEHTSELQSLMRITYAVFCLQKKKHNQH